MQGKEKADKQKAEDKIRKQIINVTAALLDILGPGKTVRIRIII